MDPEGYHWFRIEDNGIGMTEDIIKNYFLEIGSSYYSSDAFLKSKLQCNADPDFMPISRFGIGILSCFMGDKETNQVEVSTKHFREGNSFYSALRLSMHGGKRRKTIPYNNGGLFAIPEELFLSERDLCE